jgi:hypothetical protein
MKVLLFTIQEDPPSLNMYSDRDNPGMWSDLFRSMVWMHLQKDQSWQPTCQELLLHQHFQPLVDVEGKAEWRVRTRTELCNVVINVNKSLGRVNCPLFLGHLPGGTTPVQAAAKKDRLAGMSLILLRSHPASPTEASPLSGRGGDWLNFFDKFKEQMGGENFDRESLVAAAAQAGNNNKFFATRKEVDGKSKEKEDEDDINDFFDKFKR